MLKEPQCEQMLNHLEDLCRPILVYRSLGLATIHFDQCELGQCVAKSTVLATDLPLRHWDGMSCTHGAHQKPSGVTSGDLSRYPPMMMQGLAQDLDPNCLEP